MRLPGFEPGRTPVPQALTVRRCARRGERVQRDSMAYKVIGSYGVIGDMHSVALCGVDGSIDWCCLPRFDSPSVFGAILDDKKGGYFRIFCMHNGARKQMYLPDTNVLVTRFLSEDGVGEVVDFMPVTLESGGNTKYRRTRSSGRCAACGAR